jgi:hypothetical protein
MAVQFGNYVQTTLAVDINSSQTVIAVASTADFPAAGLGDFFYLTLVSALDVANNVIPPSKREIVKVTAIAGLNLAVVRGQDNTTAQAFVTGDVVELRLNAQALYDLGGGGGGGTVTSVGLAMPTDVFDVTGSPVVGAGTLTATFDTQAANTVFAGPISGAAAVPTFRALSFLDISEAMLRPRRMLTIPTGSAAFSNHGFLLTSSATFTSVVPTNPPTTIFNGVQRVRHRTSNINGSRVSNNTSVEFCFGDAQGAAFHLSGFFGVDESISTLQVLMGAATSATALVFGGATQPSAMLNCVFVGRDASDTNFQIMHNDGAGTCTKIDLGASFPADTSATDWYRFEFWGDATAAVVNYKITNMGTGDVASGVVSTNLPSAGASMGWHSGCGNGTTNAFASIGIGSVTLISEW